MNVISFKSKRYRDKLRCEIAALETLLPVSRPPATKAARRLDSQTVFRLSIAFFRTKLFLAGGGCHTRESQVEAGAPNKAEEAESDARGTCTLEQQTSSLLQALDGFLLVLTADGTLVYVSENIAQHLGFQQVDLLLRCFYGVVHPDDHTELKAVLEANSSQVADEPECCTGRATCRAVSFLCRMKCFSGATTGFLKMQCSGHMRCVPDVGGGGCAGSMALFAFCRPFVCLSTDSDTDTGGHGFWTKHQLDLRFRQMDDKACCVLGRTLPQLVGTSLYDLLHPDDLSVISAAHTALIQTEEIQTMYFRLSCADSSWVWVHTRGKVIIKHSRKIAIVFTHCPVREVNSTYIQQEAVRRQRVALCPEFMCGPAPPANTPPGAPPAACPPTCFPERHSPVYDAPSHLPHPAPLAHDPNLHIPTPTHDQTSPHHAALSHFYPTPEQTTLGRIPLGGCGDNGGVADGAWSAREYTMKFKGYGLPGGTYCQTPNPATLFFHGHLTTFESAGFGRQPSLGPGMYEAPLNECLAPDPEDRTYSQLNQVIHPSDVHSGHVHSELVVQRACARLTAASDDQESPMVKGEEPSMGGELRACCLDCRDTSMHGWQHTML